MVGSATIILTLQNGIDSGNQLAKALGEQRIMIGSAYLEGRIKEPGRYWKQRKVKEFM